MTAELAAVGMPAVLVPLPGAPGDHQTAQRRRARRGRRRGAWCPTPSSIADRLAAELDALLGDPPASHAMSAAARTLGRPDAAARFADLVEEARPWPALIRAPARTSISPRRASCTSSAWVAPA